MKTVASQTTYRDSETQTHAYAPDYTLRVGEAKPEILSLADLRLNLPSQAPHILGIAEVETIERTRAKKAFESTLPPMTDEASFDLRKKMMEQQELREMAHREREIDRTQAARLALIQQALVERDQETEFLSEQRVEAIRDLRERAKDQSLAQIQYQRVKSVRKMSKQRLALRLQAKPPSVIEHYTDFGSKVYAPQTRDGTCSKNKSPSLLSHSGNINNVPSYAALNAIESSLKTNNGNKGNRNTFSSKSVTDMKTRRKHESAKAHLDQMVRILERQKGSNTTSTKSPSSKQQKSWQNKASSHHSVQRPHTPSLVSTQPTLAAETQSALILLQKLLRGRAIQNQMFEGLGRRKELVAELRMTNASELEPELDVEESEDDLADVENSCRDMIQGEVLSELLDFLYKAQIQAQEHLRLKVVMEQAQKERRVREVEEGGRRQAEELIRARQEVVHASLQDVHEHTAESWLDDCIRDTISSQAKVDAWHEREKAPDSEQQQQQDPVMIVKDLLTTFVFPEIERRRVAEQAEAGDLKFDHAVHQALLSGLNHPTGESS